MKCLALRSLLSLVILSEATCWVAKRLMCCKYWLTVGAATLAGAAFSRSLHLFQETGSEGGDPYEMIRMSSCEQTC
jgi:hypothetical protein